jgi:hypothetical protein
LLEPTQIAIKRFIHRRYSREDRACLIGPLSRAAMLWGGGCFDDCKTCEIRPPTDRDGERDEAAERVTNEMNAGDRLCPVRRGRSDARSVSARRNHHLHHRKGPGFQISGARESSVTAGAAQAMPKSCDHVHPRPDGFRHHFALGDGERVAGPAWLVLFIPCAMIGAFGCAARKAFHTD